MFSRVEYCDMHFVHGFCDGNARAAVEKYQRRFPDRRIPSRSVFTRIHQTLRYIGSLPSVSVQSEREVVRLTNIPEMVQTSPRQSTRRMVTCIGVSRMQVWRTLHEKICILTMTKGYNIWNQATMLSVWICATG